MHPALPPPTKNMKLGQVLQQISHLNANYQRYSRKFGCREGSNRSLVRIGSHLSRFAGSNPHIAELGG